jgi:aspartate aminotransferase-like enzyme
MGSIDEGDVLSTLGAIERALFRCGIRLDLGTALAAAQTEFARG